MPLDSAEVRDLLKMLGDIATRFLSMSNPEPVARTSFDLLSQRLGLEVYFNYLSTADGHSLRLNSYAGIDEATAATVKSLECGQAVCGMVALRGERIVVEAVQTSTDPMTELIRRLGIRAYACHPLLAGSRLLGTLSFGTTTRDKFRAAELQLMATVADITAIAIDRVTLIDRDRQISRQLEQARENERRRLSRELHDHMGQHLTALSVGLNALESSPPADWRRRVRHLRTLAEEAGRAAHQVALELRPAALDDLGLVAAVQAYVAEWADRFGVVADFDASGVADGLSTSPVDTTMYRIVQEALNNVAKHARARRVSVVLTVIRGSINLVIEDDGIGFDPQDAIDWRSSSRLGLLGMQERIALADGTLIIESAPGKGTSVLARVPIVATKSFQGASLVTASEDRG